MVKINGKVFKSFKVFNRQTCYNNSPQKHPNYIPNKYTLRGGKFNLIVNEYI
jgi:hypothetical protein